MSSIEDIIFKNLLENDSYMRRAFPFLKEDYFQTKPEKLLFNVVREYILKYNSAPTVDAIGIDLQNSNSLTQKEYDELSSRISTFKEIGVQDEEWLIDKTEKFCQDKAIYNAILESIHIIEGKSKTKTTTALPEILSTALAVSFDTHVGHDYLEDGDKRYEFYHKIENRIPFDLQYFNDITNGGTPQKTLNVILAGTGVGKSLFMCHHAANCLIQNKNVLYITCEMAEERIAERIDANLMNIDLDDLKTIPEDVYQAKLERLNKSIKGKLIIKEYPTASASSSNFRYLLDELSLKRKFIPDIIFIDYLNICASSRFKNNGAVNSYTYIKSIAEELRGLAVEKCVPIFTATQTNRNGFSNSDVSLEDTSESFGLPATADFMFAIMSNEDLDKQGHILVKQLKNRYNDLAIKRKFVVGVNRSKMKLIDVDESVQAGLVGTGEEDDIGTEGFNNKFKKNRDSYRDKVSSWKIKNEE
jgi:replicative DNA helicase